MSPPMTDKLTRITAAGLLVAGIGLVEFTGSLRENYSPLSDYISELGAKGAPYSHLVNFGSFLPVALCALTLGAILWRRTASMIWIRAGASLVCGGVFVGYFGAFTHPCNAGCVADGSLRQAIHTGTGLIEYVASFVGLLVLVGGLLGRRQLRLGALSLAAACATCVGVVLMATTADSGFVGLWQRLADYSIMTTIAALALVFGRSAPSKPD